MPAAIVPTLMYRSPVADSIERVSAVLTAAQQTIKREHEPDDQAQPDEQRQVAGERAERRTARGSGTRSRPRPRTGRAARRRRRAACATAGCSGASGSFGVTRYQWPRIIAAKTPPVAAVNAVNSTSRPSVAERPAAPGERAADERQDPGSRARSAPAGRRRPDGSGGRPAPARPPRRMPAGRSRRGASQVASSATGDVAERGGQRAVAQPREQAEADRAGRRESEVAARRTRTPPEQDDRRVRAQGETGQDGPVDEGEVLGDLRGGHGASVGGPLASTRTAGGMRHGTPGRHDDHLVWPLLHPDRHRRRQDRAHRPVVRQPDEPDVGGRRRALRPVARDPRPLRPHGRRGRPGQPAATGLAVHARDEPVAGAPVARRRRRRHRHEQGRHRRGRGPAGDDGGRRPLGR